ncbi:acyl-CoA dehydrogenase family protein [Neobacillus sp. NRS-1170]|uniref:acyl-CoA dehydrogenase family protein n=1 Tax=Neobacillus sp. NRS-1170 TaxID=3233898 RepID=UPI003D2CBDBF
MFDKYIQHEHNIFRDSLRKFLNKEALPHFEQWEKEGLVPREFWRKMGDNGFLCSWVDEKYGGLSTDFLYSAILAEELERIGTGLCGISLHDGIVVPYLSTYGSEEQKHRWLSGCISGDLITAVAMTEPGTGSDLSAIKTTAIKDGDEYVINGEKIFISNGIHSDVIIVACKTNPKAVPAHKGISLIVVERDTPGFKRGKKLDKIGFHSQDTAELIFEDARVPVANLLGEEGQGFYYLMNKLQQERLVITIQAITAAEEMLKTTVDYVKSRKAFGKSISQFQNTEFKIAEMATEIEIGRNFVDQLIISHLKGKKVVTKVSMAKWWMSEMAQRVAKQCLQLHGGYGFIEEYPIARRYRDITVLSIVAGTNEIMKTIIAKSVL